MTTNVERIETRIAPAQARIDFIDQEFGEIERELGKEMAQPEPQAMPLNHLTDYRNTLRIERATCVTEVESLRTQLDNAAQQDAEAWMAAIPAEYESLPEKGKKVTERLKKAFDEVEQAIAGAFEPAAQATTLRGRAQRLAKEHGLEMLQLADVSQPSTELVERCRAISTAMDEREDEIVRREHFARRAIARLEAEEHRVAKQERRAKEHGEARRRGNTIWSEAVPIVHR